MLVVSYPWSQTSRVPGEAPRRAQVLKDEEYSHIRRQQGHIYSQSSIIHTSVCRMELLMVLLSKTGEFYLHTLWLTLATLLVSLVALPPNGLKVTGKIFPTVFLISAQLVPAIFGASEGSDRDQHHRVGEAVGAAAPPLQWSRRERMCSTLVRRNEKPGFCFRKRNLWDVLKGEGRCVSCCVRQERRTAELVKSFRKVGVKGRPETALSWVWVQLSSNKPPPQKAWAHIPGCKDQEICSVSYQYPGSDDIVLPSSFSVWLNIE